MDSPNTSEDFSLVVQRIATRVIASIENNSDIISQIESEADAVYLKSVDCTTLFANQAHEALFSDEKSSVGRRSVCFLRESIQPVSQHSDAMLMSGCHVVQFDHVGHDAMGREVRLRTFKRSLLGTGHPALAILGVTRLLEVVGNSGLTKLRALQDYWRLFSQLADFDRSIAIGLGQGVSVGDIAQQHNVTKKTVENHRASILKTLDLDTPVDLIKLVVRFQENGFGDFGV